MTTSIFTSEKERYHYHTHEGSFIVCKSKVTAFSHFQNNSFQPLSEMFILAFITPFEMTNEQNKSTCTVQIFFISAECIQCQLNNLCKQYVLHQPVLFASLLSPPYPVPRYLCQCVYTSCQYWHPSQLMICQLHYEPL